MITLHFHLQPQYKYELFHINFTSKKNTAKHAISPCANKLNELLFALSSSLKTKSLIFYFTELTAPFKNMQTIKLKAQPTNAFFATVNQMLGCFSQLPTTVEHVVIKSLCTVQTTEQCSAAVGTELGGAKHLIDGSEKRISWVQL